MLRLFRVYGWLLLALAAQTHEAQAELRVPAIIGDHMVLQRDQPNRLWGWSQPGQAIAVEFADKTYETRCGDDGRWEVTLEAQTAGGPFRLGIAGGDKRLSFTDVLVGEVWICSGQSNMAFPVQNSYNGDLARQGASAFPKIRLISVPQAAAQTPQDDFGGEWQVCSADSVGTFSAVGYYFGRQLHETLGVPVGLIDNAWGGSASEAWVTTELLAADERYQTLLDHWEELARTYDADQVEAQYQKRLAQWQQRARTARADNQQVPPRPRKPRNPLQGQHRPGNLYNGVLHPTIGYGIRGAIWYQGEANASRAQQYRHLFPLMIDHWRTVWKQGDFPFYWVQLADFRPESTEPGPSDWAELREAQTLAMTRLPRTGQAVTIDLGEGKDIHPRNKHQVAMRLARWALADTYGRDLAYRSPMMQSVTIQAGKVQVKFDTGSSPLITFDQSAPIGFAVAGKDQQFVTAQARLVADDTVEVWSDQVAAPVAVRYAWADNPVCNLYNRAGLPATPFRSDDWPGVTDGRAVR